MSKRQLEAFLQKVETNRSLQKEVDRCGANNSCVVAVGIRSGHKFSPARLSRWQRDHQLAT